MNWQPIETAPKDGQVMLAYAGLGDYCILVWQDPVKDFPDMPEFWDEEPGWSIEEIAINDSVPVLHERHLTHWTPLTTPAGDLAYGPFKP